MAHNNTFGALRLVAALLVTFSHSWPLALGSGVAEPPYPLLPFSLGTVGVYIFFAISGMLVTQSLMSNSLPRYAWHRLLRIFPALFVCLLFTTFIVAPLFGTGLGWFFTAEPYRHVVVNTLLFKDAETGVSGVFASNPLPSALNDPIWTLVWEVRAYLLLVLIVPLGRKWWGLALTLGLVILSALLVPFPAPQIPRFLMAFFLGGLICQFDLADRHRGLIAAVAVLPLFTTYGTPLFDWAFTIWIVAAVFAIGNIRTNAFLVLRRFDPTYGIYLYSWPMAQILVSLFRIADPWVLALLTVLGAGTLATGSWFLIERPAMALRDWTPWPKPVLPAPRR